VDTLTMHRLRLPPSLRRNLATTNLIESAFSTVETVPQCEALATWRSYLCWGSKGPALGRVPLEPDSRLSRAFIRVKGS
jgi:hypothetical protein